MKNKVDQWTVRMGDEAQSFVHIEHYFPKGYNPDEEPWKSIKAFHESAIEKAREQGRVDREREIYGLKDKPAHASEPVFDPNLTVPSEIMEAADKVANWATLNGFKRGWCIGPVSDRSAAREQGSDASEQEDMEYICPEQFQPEIHTDAILDNRTVTIDEEITKLTAEWYELIGPDHHKDRDCHFYINKVWSYGDPPKYRLEHYGYLFDKGSETFKTATDASHRLKEWLTEMIAEHAKWEHSE